jgi:hypothetical protein
MDISADHFEQKVCWAALYVYEGPRTRGFSGCKKMIELNPESRVWVRRSVLQKINYSSNSSSENQTWFQSSSELE